MTPCFQCCHSMAAKLSSLCSIFPINHQSKVLTFCFKMTVVCFTYDMQWYQNYVRVGPVGSLLCSLQSGSSHLQSQCMGSLSYPPPTWLLWSQVLRCWQSSSFQQQWYVVCVCVCVCVCGMCVSSDNN